MNEYAIIKSGHNGLMRVDKLRESGMIGNGINLILLELERMGKLYGLKL